MLYYTFLGRLCYTGSVTRARVWASNIAVKKLILIILFVPFFMKIIKNTCLQSLPPQPAVQVHVSALEHVFTISSLIDIYMTKNMKDWLREKESFFIGRGYSATKSTTAVIWATTSSRVYHSNVLIIIIIIYNNYKIINKHWCSFTSPREGENNEVMYSLLSYCTYTKGSITPRRSESIDSSSESIVRLEIGTAEGNIPRVQCAKTLMQGLLFII